MYEWYLIIIIVFLNADNKLEEMHIKYNEGDPKVNYVSCKKIELTKDFRETYIDYQRNENVVFIKSDCTGFPVKGMSGV